MIDNPFSVERRPSQAYAIYVNPVDGSVPPRPASQGGRNKNQDRWDSMYGATHFPDGSMK